MELWLFFTIFGGVIFIPSLILFFVLNRFKNTIVVLFKLNGTLKKVIIDNKILEKGEITQIGKNKIKPIKLNKNEILYGKWRRWIVKPDVESKEKNIISDKEIEEYLNNEDLIKLYLAGKFKDTLIFLVGATLFCVIAGVAINMYLNSLSPDSCLDYTNTTALFIKENVKQGILSLTNKTM